MNICLRLATAMLLAAAAPAFAQTMRPGLWELQTEVPQGAGATGGMDAGQQAQMQDKMAAAQQKMQESMAKMTPEQRQQMQAMMGRQGGMGGPAAMVAPGARPGAIRMCFTREMVERHEFASRDERCKQTSMEKSGNTLRFKMACTGTPPMQGEGQVTFASDKSYTSKMVLLTERDGKTQRTEFHSSGTFISADCGDVKPMSRAP